MMRQIVGYLIFLVVGYLMSEKITGYNNKWKTLLKGIVFQIVVAFALTHVTSIVSALETVSIGIMKLRDATLEGTKFVFGYIGGGDLPFDVKQGYSTFVFAFQALPTVILVGTLAAILTHLRILPIMTSVIGSVFKYVFNVDSSIGMVGAAKIFIGQLEAPLLIKHKLACLRKSDMFTILTLAFATSSCAVMPIYAGLLEGICPAPMKHLLISSVLSVISVFIIVTIINPNEQQQVHLPGDTSDKSPFHGFMGAMSKGLSDGFFVWWCIVGSLIGMVALIALLNYLLSTLPDFAGAPLTLQRIFGFCMYPIAWLMGIEQGDISAVSQILGTKMAVNETIAFFDLAKANISEVSVVKTLYAINNFGNFACIGITISGLSALAPTQKCITEIAGRAFLAAILSVGLTSTIIGIFL